MSFCINTFWWMALSLNGRTTSLNIMVRFGINTDRGCSLLLQRKRKDLMSALIPSLPGCYSIDNNIAMATLSECTSHIPIEVPYDVLMMT